jgi:hypothetical protein
MKYDPVSRLSRHINLIQSRPSAPSEILETVRLTRLAIEKGDAKKRYPTLAMYCDWAMHSELDRNPGAWQLLKRIDTKLQTLASSTDMGVVIEEISEGLSLALLRSDFVGLFKEKGIDTSLFTVLENWIMFQQCLLNDLEGRPIGFPDDIATSPKAKGRTVYDEMLANRAANGDYLGPVRRVSVTVKHDAEPGRPAGYYWNVRVRQDSPEHYADINGYLQLDTTPLVDAAEQPAAA